MTKPPALQADFTSYKPVPSRKVLQLVFEVPLETQKATFEVLGYPTPGESTWVAVARLNTKPQAQAEGATAPNKSWDTMSRSQRAALRLKSEAFQIWLAEKYPATWDDFYINQGMLSPEAADATLKDRLGIASKRDLDNDPVAAPRFDSLLTDYDHRDMVR